MSMGTVKEKVKDVAGAILLLIGLEVLLMLPGLAAYYLIQPQSDIQYLVWIIWAFAGGLGVFVAMDAISG